MRNAASILVLANAHKYNSMKVLMIKRHTKARFMASMYVFPGGVLEESDGPVVADNFGTTGGIATTTDPTVDIDGLLPFRKGALRELWEETSVALDSKGAASGKAETPDYSLTNAITPFAHWVTPVQEKYRYDTWFFAHSVSNDETATGLDMTQCPRELADLRWVEPKEALELHRSDAEKDFRLPPPTYIFLDWLSRYQNTDAFMNSISCYKHNPKVSVPEVLPIYENPGQAGGRINIGSNKLHLPDGEYPARLFHDPGFFCLGDSYVKEVSERLGAKKE